MVLCVILLLLSLLPLQLRNTRISGTLPPEWAQSEVGGLRCGAALAAPGRAGGAWGAAPGRTGGAQGARAWGMRVQNTSARLHTATHTPHTPTHTHTRGAGHRAQPARQRPADRARLPASLAGAWRHALPSLAAPQRQPGADRRAAGRPAVAKPGGTVRLWGRVAGSWGGGGVGVCVWLERCREVQRGGGRRQDLSELLCGVGAVRLVPVQLQPPLRGGGASPGAASLPLTGALGPAFLPAVRAVCWIAQRRQSWTRGAATRRQAACSWWALAPPFWRQTARSRRAPCIP